MQNSCTGAIDFGSIIYYSHLIPLVITAILSVFVLFKSRFSLLSKIFFAFSVAFCLWLLGDVVAWASRDYDLISFFWASLDYLNILFFLLGAYFFAVLVRGNDIPVWEKGLLLFASLPAWIVTLTNKSITGFNQPWCEAFNNSFLTTYKIIIEFSVIVFIIAYTAWHYTRIEKKKQILLVASGLVLFFTIFSITEYIASSTGIYEINLYSLFILPIFLGIIIYTIVNMNIFQIRLIGTQLMVYVLLVMVGSQFFFLENSTDQTLTVITLAIAIFLGYLLIRSSQREAQARVHIEELVVKLETANDKLQSLDQLKTEFLSLASHQLRSPLTAIKGYTSMLLEGSFGAMTIQQKEAVDRVFQSVQHLTKVVNDLLNVSKIEQGGMHYEKKRYDVAKSAQNVTEELTLVAKNKGLALSYEDDATAPYMIMGDEEKIRQVVLNLIDNSIKYTQAGNIWVRVAHVDHNVLLSVHDTGMGMTEEIKQSLFKKFARGDGGKVNTSGSGLGLYLAKEIVEAHEGKVWVESPGAGKGSTFYVELKGSK